MAPRHKLELPHKLRAELEAKGAISSAPSRSPRPQHDRNPRPSKRQRLDEPPAPPVKSAPTAIKPAKPSPAAAKSPAVKAKKQTPLEKLLVKQGKAGDKLAKAKSVLPPRNPAEADEDDEIAWLEAHLGVGKSKWNEELEEDGLDGALASLLYIHV
jgi:hypothetical protein